MDHLAVHNRVVGRLFERLYNRRIINNVDRGAYMEYLIELALQELDAAWECMPGWSMWDIENNRSGARVEVNQSAKLQTWSSDSQTSGSAPRFGIKPTKWYWDNVSAAWFETEPRRSADVYVFAYHSEGDRAVADHRHPGQWEFYVVPERLLPSLQKSIGLGPVRGLGQRCSFETLALVVTKVINGLPALKAALPQP
jgi:hypothetical protein